MSTADYFLKIDGIEGESEDDKHMGEIEILSFSFGASNAGSMSYGGGGGTGKVAMQDFNFTKRHDKASPKLFLHCCNGKHIAKAVFVARKQGGEALEYLKITLSDILVTSISDSGSEGSGDMMEQIAFNFAKIESEYTPQTAQGRGGGKVPFNWDVKANKGG